MVPFMDMKARHAPMKADLMRVIGQVIDSGAFAGGPYVERFERDFAEYCGTNHAVGVGSGTDALWLALVALGIGPGDEVVTVPMTFAATVEAICLAGAKPVFVDIHPRTHTMDPEALQQAITPRTKAVVPVHLFGQMADMEPILRIAESHGLRVIEDAAQAHGAEYRGRRAGSLGDAGCFSFYPSKNLGALGEAGAVVTNDEQVASKLRLLRDHGQSGKNRHALIGWNSRMDGVQAAVLSHKLRFLDAENAARRNHAAFYDEALRGLSGIRLPETARGREHVYHLYVVRARDRRSLVWSLEEDEVGYGVHYPVPVHLQPAYRVLGHHVGDFPVAEQCAAEFVSLPMFAELTFDQLSAVAMAVRDSETSLAVL
jgi:dTDP-4-amino-4,6-dideoxygalactose transaminase